MTLAQKKRGGACSGHRLGRVPPGDTLSGFCAALRPLPTCGGQPLRELRWARRRTNWVHFARLPRECQGLGSSSAEAHNWVSTLADPLGSFGGTRLTELSYVHGASQTPLLGDTIFQNLRRTAERLGDREALVVNHQGHRSTYRELLDECELVARGLLARGVQKGDRVGIWSPNRYEWVITQFSTAAIGAILVNINPAYRTSELEYVL